MVKIALKTFTTNSRKLSQEKFHNFLTCEWTAHYACRNPEMNLKYATTNRFNFRMMTSLMESCGLRLACLDCNLLIMCCLFLSCSKKSFPVILNSLVEDKPRCENYISMSLNIFYLAWYFAHLVWILVNWSLRPSP